MDPIKGFDPIFICENESESRRHIIKEATGATRVPRNQDDLDPLATRPNILYWSITGIVWPNGETGLPLIGQCDSRCKELTPHFPTMTSIDNF